MCLTVGVDETLKLEKCALEGDTRKNQQWFFQTINTNPDVIENFPDVTLQDIQEVRLEQRRAITTTINSPIFGGILKANHSSGNIIWDMIAWGLLKNGQYPNGKCVTHHGLEKQLTMEDCYTDWTKCQEELKTFITSNDPLVQSQVSVGNCSKATTKGQAFEYTSDFTIRPFNTNACVKANTTIFILQECANTSSIWGTFKHTGQLMATDRTGLHSPASDRKCLTLKVGRLSLGHCHGSSRKQQFNFEYRNPHQIRTLSAAAIIALHTQQSLDGTQLPLIPPLLKRETQQEIPEAASLTLEQVPEVPIKDETESGLPQNIEEFDDKIKFEISKMHEQYKIETEHENKLAKEICDRLDYPSVVVLDLITEFEELHLNDFDYSLKSHPAHETMEMEQLNILNDLVGLMQESNSKSVSDIVMSEKQDNQIGTMFSWMTAPTPLTMERTPQSRPAQPSAPKQRNIYPIMEENWESDQALKKNNEETLVMEQNSEDAVQHNEASDIESQPETNYLVIESDIETESETQRDGLFGDYGFYPPTFEFNPNATQKTTLPKCSNCAMKTHPTLSAARADAIQKRTQTITRLRKQEIFLEMIDAPREKIRRCIIQKLGLAEWDYHPKAEFLNQKFNNKTLLHTSVKAGKLDITDLLLDYGADPDIEDDGQTIAHRAAAENNKLLIRILRYHKYKFSSYNSLGETPLMVAIAYGHEEVASYLWISSNVAQMAKDNSTVLHYAAKHGNNTLARAACERKIHININQTTKPGNYTALHLATMYRQDHIGAYPDITDVNGNTPRDYAFDEHRRNIFEDWNYIRGRKRKASDNE
ncbi:hypothetical protein OUZ56_011489 [Daphnia magna]|uniref:Ricin B lectin domain-containing protein n=1 Tax=Daphnia magna TaxID=35525 RepID=A0ABQ9Z0G4_9CRUS|nr:hypothetical protein OUZ56_011489 [Daphnia magna]